MLVPEYVCKDQTFMALPKKAQVSVLRKWQKKNLHVTFFAYALYTLFMIPSISFCINADLNKLYVVLGFSMFSILLTSLLSKGFNRLTKRQQLTFIEGIANAPHDIESKSSVFQFAKNWYKKYNRS